MAVLFPPVMYAFYSFINWAAAQALGAGNAQGARFIQFYVIDLFVFVIFILVGFAMVPITVKFQRFKREFKKMRYALG